MMRSFSPRLIFLLILAIFVLPLAFAWLMHVGVLEFERRPTRNQGYLVQPPVHFNWTWVQSTSKTGMPGALEGHWVVLHRVPPDCALSCLDRVTELRQVHRASGRDQDRIVIALLFDREPPASMTETLRNIFPQFNLLWPAEAALVDALGAMPAEAGEVDFYLVDPRGDIMMTYNDSDSAAKLSKDLKTLLTWSGLDRR